MTTAAQETPPAPSSDERERNSARPAAGAGPEMTVPLRLLLVPMAREAGKAVAALLTEIAAIEPVLCAHTALSDIVEAATESQVDLLLLALGKAGDLARVAEIARALPSLPLVVVSRDGDESLNLRAIQLGAQDALGAAALARSGAVAPLRRAVERHRLTRQRHEHDTRRAVTQAAAGVLDRLPLGVMILDARGQVLITNSKARQIIAAGDGLVVDPRSGTFRAESAEETKALLTLVMRTIQGAIEPEEGCALTISRPSMKQPLCLMVTPLGSPAQGKAPRRNGVAIFLSDPEDGIDIEEDVLRDLYGLTRVESRLALGLVRGKQLDELAKESRVSVHTVRSQLKQIFRKTGANRQAEVVKLLLTGPAAIRITPKD